MSECPKINSKNILGHSDIAPSRKKDPGEKFPWQYFAKRKIGTWHSLSEKILKKNRSKLVNSKIEKLFLKNILKIGYKINNPTKLKDKKYLYLVVKAFQRRFRQELINGKIDKECFLISENLTKN